MFRHNSHLCDLEAAGCVEGIGFHDLLGSGSNLVAWASESGSDLVAWASGSGNDLVAWANGSDNDAQTLTNTTVAYICTATLQAGDVHSAGPLSSTADAQSLEQRPQMIAVGLKSNKFRRKQ